MSRSRISPIRTLQVQITADDLDLIDNWCQTLKHEHPRLYLKMDLALIKCRGRFGRRASWGGQYSTKTFADSQS